jgi:hypothetical protein
MCVRHGLRRQLWVAHSRAALLEDPAKSYHARRRITSADFFDNRLIFGDNLLARAAMGQPLWTR